MGGTDGVGSWGHVEIETFQLNGLIQPLFLAQIQKVACDTVCSHDLHSLPEGALPADLTDPGGLTGGLAGLDGGNGWFDVFGILNLSFYFLIFWRDYRFSLCTFDSQGLLGFFTFLFLWLNYLFMAGEVPLLFLLELLFFDLGEGDSSLVFLVVLLKVVDILDELLGLNLLRLWDVLIFVDVEPQNVVLDVWSRV